MGKIDERPVLVVCPKLVGHGHRDGSVAAEVCADRGQGSGWKEDSNFFPARPTHCDDVGVAGVVADAPGAGAKGSREQQ